MEEEKEEITSCNIIDGLNPYKLYNVTLNVDDSGEFKILNNGVSIEHVKKADNSVHKILKNLEEKAKVNSITAADKVMFLNNSKFPRISFNRYSTTAKRVESMKVATKLVLRNDFNIYERNHRLMTIVDTDRNEVNLSTSYSAIRNVMRNMKDKSLYNAEKNDYNVTLANKNNIILSKLTLPELNGDYATYRAYETHIYSIGGLTTKDTLVLDQLLNNEIDLDKLVLDAEATRFISTFKEELNDERYKFLNSILQSEGDKEVALQVLVQLQISGWEHNLYGLLYNMKFGQLAAIGRTKALTSVDGKNFLDTYKLRPWITGGVHGAHHKMLLTKAFKEVSKDNKEKLFNNVKELLSVEFAEEFGIEKNIINLSYADTKEESE